MHSRSLSLHVRQRRSISFQSRCDFLFIFIDVGSDISLRAHENNVRSLFAKYMECTSITFSSCSNYPLWPRGGGYNYFELNDFLISFLVETPRFQKLLRVVGDRGATQSSSSFASKVSSTKRLSLKYAQIFHAEIVNNLARLGYMKCTVTGSNLLFTSVCYGVFASK